MNKAWISKRGIVVLMFLLSASAYAAERRLLTVTEIMEIDAPPAAVWNAIKSFDGIAAWIPVVAKCYLTEGSNGKVGALRRAELKNGWQIDEQLEAYSDEAMSLSYTIFDGPFPIDNYLATTSVRANRTGTGSIMIWTSRFQRRNPLANPPEGEGDAALTTAITGIYRESMAIVKKSVETATK
jgi:hypothetical protein